MKTAKTLVTALVLLSLTASLAFLTFQASGKTDPVRISGFPDWTRSPDQGTAF